MATTIYGFRPRQAVNALVRPWHFTDKAKAMTERALLLSSGGNPSELFSYDKNPHRALRHAWLVEGKTRGQILGRLNRALVREGLIDRHHNGFRAVGNNGFADKQAAAAPWWWDDCSRLAVYAQSGSNEGHWVEIDRIGSNGKVPTIVHLGSLRVEDKGLELALAIVVRVSELLAV